LSDYASKTSKAFADVYNAIFASMSDPGFQMAIYSNYGLLLAIETLNPSALYSGNDLSGTPNPLQTTSMTDALTYASWQALVGVTFQWYAAPPDTTKFSDMLCAVIADPQNSSLNIPPFTGSPYNPPPALALNQVFLYAQGQLDDLIGKLMTWQQYSEKSPNHAAVFYSMSPFSTVAWLGGDYSLGGFVYYWYLRDQNSNPMQPELVQALFGSEWGTVALASVDSNQPLQSALGGWYWNTEPLTDAITYPYDVFMNWAMTAPSGYSPLKLEQEVIQRYVTGVLHPETYDLTAALAIDNPPPPPITISSPALNFTPTLIGQSASLDVTLTNGQSSSLTINNVTIAGAGFTLAGSYALTLGPNTSETFTVNFSPASLSPSQGTLTIECEAYNSLLIVNLSGVGVPPPPRGTSNVIYSGDPSVWGQGLTVYLFDGYDNYQLALDNWSTGNNSSVTTMLPQQMSQLSGMPAGWLAVSGNTANGTELFMIVALYPEFFLQFGADGAQPAAVPYGAPAPSASLAAGSIAMVPTASPQTVWNNGLNYAIFEFDNLAGALQNWNTADGATASGYLNGDGTPAKGLPQGWLVLYGTPAGSTEPIPYMITQYYNELALAIQPYYDQALLYVVTPTTS
jgi:Abnormal spindle-like microcephaly-assoc'd, ASPM-SPD-2-Hydin